MDGRFDLAVVGAGVVAYGVAVVTAALLVFLVFRANAFITREVDEEGLLRGGHRSIAISLGAILLSQAVLLRHAVHPVMVMVRELFLEPPTLVEALVTAARCAGVVSLLTVVAFGSTALAAFLFTRMTRGLDEHAEIHRDNVAVAIFHAFVLLAITAVLNEGMEDLSRSLVPFGGRGVLTLP
ncbi:MAG: DUF350 domain-containing protein [Thermoanaerobaculia bacterium]|nr:DUF350 domain-containing protein [Thermoanaerobaculia bacterium]